MCSALFSFYSQCPGLPICPYGYIIIAACGQRLMPSAYPSVSSSFSSKLLLSVPLFWPSQSQLSPFVFLPRSLLEYQSSNNSQVDISSQFLAQMGTSYLIPSLSSMTLPNLHLFQSKQTPLLTLTCELFSKSLGSTSSFFPPKSQFITFSVAVFSLQPQLPSLFTPPLAPSPCFPPAHHPADSLSFPHSPQLPGQTTTLQRQDFKNIFKRIKQHILPLNFIS